MYTKTLCNFSLKKMCTHIKWASVTMAWHILRLWMEEMASRYRG